MTWASRSFFINRFLRERTRRLEDKETSLRLGGLAYAVSYSKQAY